MPEIEVRGPFVGLNLRSDSGRLGPGEAESALNLVLDGGKMQKRPGYDLIDDLRDEILNPPSKRPQGYYDYQKPDGTILPLAIVDGVLYTLQGGVFAAVPAGVSGAPTLSTTKHASFATFNGRVYYCADSEIGVTDGSFAFKAVIPRPAVPAVAVSGSAGTGNLTGTYDYKVSFYSTTWGQESAASDVTVTVLLAGQNTQITQNDAAPDSRVDRLRVYRRKVSAQEVVWQLVKESTTIQGTIIDDTLDVDANALRIAPLSFAQASPNFRYLAYHQDVLWAGGIESEPNNLYLSRAGEPWTLGDFVAVGSGTDNDPLTSIHSFQGLLVVGKAESIWTIAGNSPATVTITKLVVGKGVRSHFSVVERGGVLYYLGEDAFYAFDGREPVDISSRKVLPLVADRNALRDRECVGVDDFHQGAILWTFSGTGSTVNDQLLGFFYRNSEEVGDLSWCPWDMEDTATLALVTDETTGVRNVHYGFETGVMARSQGSADDAQTIAFRWRSGRIDGGVTDRYKVWRDLVIETDVEAEGGGIQLAYLLDNASTPLAVVTHNQTKEITRRRLNRSSREIRIDFSGGTIGPAVIRGWSLSFVYAGRS